MPGTLIFITGATGFIGSQVVAATLRAGYNVRLSIRKPEQDQLLRERHAEFLDQIETVVIPDITDANSIKGHLIGVNYVFHIASPMPGTGSDLITDYINPAVKGTESILSATIDFAAIRKVVIVASILSLLPLTTFTSKEVEVKG